MPTISVPGHGDVEFPDSMSEGDITAALKKIAPPPDERSMVSRVFGKLFQPLPGAQGIIDQQKAANAEGGTAFPLTKDSGDVRAGAQAALSGVPGYQGDAEPDEAKGRLARFRQEHPVLSFLLPVAAGLGKPSALPVARAAQEGGPVTDILRNLSNKAGRRTLYGGAETLSTKFPVSDASIDAAHEVGAFKPLGTTEHAADTLSDALEQAGNLKGDVMQQIEKAGLQGPDSANLAQLLRTKAAWIRKNTAGTGIPDLYEKIAADIEAAGSGGRLTAQQTENIKQSLQDAAKYGMPGEKMLNRARRNIASTVRQGNEDAIAADAVSAGTPEAQAASDALVPAKQTYALLAPAAAAAEKGLSQSVKRNAFSLRDALMAGPMLAAHGPMAAAEAGLATKALRTYGPSTAAWAFRKAAGLTSGSDAAVQALVLRGIPQELAESIVQSQTGP